MRDRSRGGAALWLVLGLILVGAIGVPVALHIGQRRHDVLPLDLAARFPDDAQAPSGALFATTLAELVAHELDGGTGWRPNDLPFWGPGLFADNNANRQRGILQAVRESVRVFKDHLTKVSSNEYDPNLLAADTDFRNDPERFMLPSAESKLRSGVAHLRAYIEGLRTDPPTSRPLNRRNIEAIRLLQAWGDLLGDAHARLFREAEGWTTTDDDFYQCQGITHAIAHLMPAFAREYAAELTARSALAELTTGVTSALSTAAVLKPLVVLDGGPGGLFANHRRNLDAYVTEARQKIYSIREELEK